MDFSDANDSKRGMAVYDFYKDMLEFEDWTDGPQYVKTSLSEILDNPDQIIKAGARVKIDVDEEITYDESIQLRETLSKQYGLREITLDEKITLDVELSEVEAEVEELKLESTTQVIEALLSRIKDESIDTDMLLAIYRSAASSDSSAGMLTANTVFKDITIRNFLSYGNDEAKIDLEFSDPTMILGKNYDSVVEGQVDSNGAGKSTILNALLMCLYGKNLVDAKLDQQINNANKKNMYIAVQFKSGDWCYKVERYRKNKPMGGDGIRVLRHTDFNFDEKEHDVTYDSIANAEAEVAKAIGIPYDMFIRIVVFSATHEPFLSLPSSHASKANQRDIIEELFGLTEITQKAEFIKKLLADSKKDFKLLEEINDRLVKEHERHRGQLTDARHRMDAWEIDNADRENAVKAQLEALRLIDTVPSIEGFEDAAKYREELADVERSTLLLSTNIKNIKANALKVEQWNNDIAVKKANQERELEALSKIDFAEHRLDLESLAKNRESLTLAKSRKAELERQCNDYARETSSIESKQEDLVGKMEHLKDNKCPFCSQNYEGSMQKFNEMEQQVIILEAELDTIWNPYHDAQKELKKAINDVTFYTEEVEKYASKNIPTNLDVLESKKESIIEWLSNPKNFTNPLQDGEDNEELLKEFEVELVEVEKEKEYLLSKISMAEEFIHSSFRTLADVKAHEVRIESLEARVKEIRKEQNPITDVVLNLEKTKLEDLKTDEINKLDKLIKHQDFLVKLLTKKDSFIRKALLNKSIPLLNGRLRHYLDKVGLPHRVTFNEEMGVDISQFGATLEYGQFSSGQKARVNICLAFAFRDVLQSRFGKTNLCILDECLDVGLGAVGVTLVAKMVKAIAIENGLSMFIISHKDEISSMFDRKLNIELRNGFSNIAGIT